MRDIISQEIGGARRHVIVLAIDGIPASLARLTWSPTSIETLSSVLPTNSFSAWLSSVTGLAVADHGIVGTVFRDSDGEMVHMMQNDQRLAGGDGSTMFTDAVELGYQAIAIEGDWRKAPLSWRTTLMAGAERIAGPTFFSGMGQIDQAVPTLHRSIDEVLTNLQHRPGLIWCFLDTDLYVHHHGYDFEVRKFLTDIDWLAHRWRQQGHSVCAYSDHGLVETTHDPNLAALLDQLPEGCRMGGAGRIRWIYPADNAGPIASHLSRVLPKHVKIADPSIIAPAGSLGFERIGPIVLVANGTRFLTFGTDRFEHGGDSDEELQIPFARWF